MGCPAAIPGGQSPKSEQMSLAGGVMPTGGIACGFVGAERTHPSPLASKARLLHSGCTAKLVLLFMLTMPSLIHAHLSPFSLPCASFQPSCTVAKLSGSVTASEYSWPTTMLQLSKMPLPNELLFLFTLCSPQPTATQSVFCHGMNEYSIRYGLPRPSMLVVCVW